MSKPAGKLVLECVDCSETWSFENTEHGYNQMISAGSNHVVDSDCDTVLESAVFQEGNDDREVRADGGTDSSGTERAVEQLKITSPRLEQDVFNLTPSGRPDRPDARRIDQQTSSSRATADGATNDTTEQMTLGRGESDAE